MNKNKLKELTWMISLITLFIFIRSIHFPLYLNFSHDQAIFSIEALEILREKPIKLIGPPISLNFEGRQFFQGAIIYYFQMIFLVLGNFDPISSGYFFMIFTSFMLIPLYFGVKNLINKSAALIIIILYTLLPYYIDYTRFFWNPNFQFSLLPLLIFFMGLFNSKRKLWVLMIISIFLGILIQFHYQLVIALFGLTIYYFLILKLNLKFLITFITGLLIGFSPIIIFELRNEFYNFNTLILYLKNINWILPKPGNSELINYSHYLLSLSLFLFIIIIHLFRKKINSFFIFPVLAILLFWSFSVYTRVPPQGFRMAQNWNYLDEEKAYKIIRKENLENYNIANLIYDTKAYVQKYLHDRDGLNINFDDYKDNKFLFVLSSNDNFMYNPAYEVSAFKPSTLIQQWPINSYYNLYLLKRLN